MKLLISGADKPEIMRQIKSVLDNASAFPQVAETAELIEKMQTAPENDFTSGHQPMMPNIGQPFGRTNASKQSALDYFSVNLTNRKNQKNIDPVIGRDNEIDRLIQILCRRTKNNPVLLGDPGVGKTAIVEGLAKRIMLGQVPDILRNKKIHALDMGMLIAGTTFRGEFEARLQHITDEIAGNPNIIVFIDELHNIVGAGSNNGAMDASNILKPVLARGLMRCIGATTPNEFKKYIENDPALERRFQPIYVKQSSVEDTIKILEGIKKNYEDYHNVIITPEAIESAARLSDRYMTSQFLPDKAIDLMDESAAAKKLISNPSPLLEKLARAEKNLEEIIEQKQEAVNKDDYKQAVKYKELETKAGQVLAKLKDKIKKNSRPAPVVLNKDDIVRQLAKIINVPLNQLEIDETSRLQNLEADLSANIIGQNQVIQNVAQVIRRSSLNLSRQDKPRASFMFVGQSSVGKTELAKTLAKTLYPSGDALIQLNMSEYNEAFGVSKLLGSPAGYVGYKEANQFTDKLKLNPYSVVLFDEIDKAHKDVTKLLLQILEEGQITDSTGRKISLRHAIIIMTTTIGAKEAGQKQIGFDRLAGQEQEQLNILTDRLKEYFGPELLNRVGHICFFNDLDPANLAQIAELELNQLNLALKKYRTKIMASQKVLNEIVRLLPNPQSANARQVRRFVASRLEDLMSEIILNKKIKASYQITASQNEIFLK